MNTSQSSYWFQTPQILWQTNKISEVIPSANMSYSTKVNALVRLSIYIGIVLAVVMRNYLWLYVPILTMFLTYVLYLFRKMHIESTTGGDLIESMSQNLEMTDLSKSYSASISSGLDNQHSFDAQNEYEHFNSTAIDATYPSLSNPFMNPMPFDNRKRPEAANPEAMNSKIETYFNKTLFREVGDIFSKENSQREFYTVPTTTFPSNQNDYAKWLYGMPPSCKDGNGAQCVANNESRLYGGGAGSYR